jgi:hypothetical protein
LFTTMQSSVLKFNRKRTHQRSIPVRSTVNAAR